MTIKSDVDPSTRCPDCNRETETRIVYGYPLREDFISDCVYGGDACPSGSPTHYCHHCEVSWCLAECPSVFFAFPSTCYFCDESLDANDKLKYCMEFEEWIANDDSGLRLTDDTFTQSLYPVCSHCRDGIRTNLDELAAEEGQEDQQLIVAVRLAIWGGLFFALLIAGAVLALK